MKNGTSRRDFVKAAVAASLTGVVASAEEPGKRLTPPAPEATKSALPKHSLAHLAAQTEEAGYPRVYTGRRLARISCPLGGIGTGGIGLGGRGNLQDWEIFNRPDIGKGIGFSFPSLWVQTAGAAPYSVVAERRFLPPYDLDANGFGTGGVPGLPRLAEAKFFGSFPLSRIEFEDSDCPVEVSLEAFSPFQPLDADASGLPCAVLEYSVRNPGKATAEAVLAWSINNPVGRS
ncbi:MAG: GH116 family glycosyl-hydrolase, partial [Terracidiphilus sp.]